MIESKESVHTQSEIARSTQVTVGKTEVVVLSYEVL